MLHENTFTFQKGKEYTSTTNPKRTVPEKTFTEIISCCRGKCFEKIEVAEQRKTHDYLQGKWRLPVSKRID